MILILSAVDITSNSFTAVHIAEYYNNSNKPIERGKTESGPHKYSIAFYAESEILHLSWRIGTGELSNARGARQKFDTEIESLAGTRLRPSLDLRRAGSTNVVTHWSPSSETFLLRDLPLSNANNLSVIGIYPAKKSNRIFWTKPLALMRKFWTRSKPTFNDRHRLFQA